MAHIGLRWIGRITLPYYFKFPIPNSFELWFRFLSRFNKSDHLSCKLSSKRRFLIFDCRFPICRFLTCDKFWLPIPDIGTDLSHLSLLQAFSFFDSRKCDLPIYDLRCSSVSNSDHPFPSLFHICWFPNSDLVWTISPECMITIGSCSISFWLSLSRLIYDFVNTFRKGLFGCPIALFLRVAASWHQWKILWVFFQHSYVVGPSMPFGCSVCVSVNDNPKSSHSDLSHYVLHHMKTMPTISPFGIDGNPQSAGTPTAWHCRLHKFLPLWHRWKRTYCSWLPMIAPPKIMSFRFGSSVHYFL